VVQRLGALTRLVIRGASGRHARLALLILAVAVEWPAAVPGAAQTPAPFPRPGQQPPVARPLPPTTTPVPAQPAAARPGDPTEAMLGAPIYPGAQYIASYDAGTGQRYYLFGTAAEFVQIVAYYKTMLKDKGDLIFEEPPVHMFDLSKFKEETMAFPPSVTVKDYARGGADGYLNPKPGASPARFKTIIQIVPAPVIAPK
jgi:hypothetical protein